MHVADGILSPAVCAVTGAVAAGAVGYSLHRLKDSLADRTVPLTGMTAALVFAGQMVNFPLFVFGTPVSGHLLGGVLAAALVGPWAGCLAITLVLVVQCVLFADGGLLSLGANIVNMGVIGAMGGSAVYQSVRRALGGGPVGIVVGVVVASWLSVMAAASMFCLEFRLSWPDAGDDFGRIFSLMVSFHSAIGIGEALITGLVVSVVLQQQPSLLQLPATTREAWRPGRVVVAGAVCALAVAAFLAPFASSYEDGLEAVASQTFGERTAAEARVLVLEDYAIPLPFNGWKESALWEKVSVSLAGIVGTTSVLAMALGFGWVVRRRTLAVDAGHAD